jgi:hypothetical protein
MQYQYQVPVVPGTWYRRCDFLGRRGIGQVWLVMTVKIYNCSVVVYRYYSKPTGRSVRVPGQVPNSSKNDAVFSWHGNDIGHFSTSTMLFSPNGHCIVFVNLSTVLP